MRETERGLSSMTTPRRKLIDSLQDREFREAYVAEHLHQGFAFQVKSARKRRDLTQADLAEIAEMKQSRISQIEDPSYEGLTLTTAKRIASALDVALLLRLVPYSKFTDFIASSTSISMRDWMEPIPAFDEDAALTRVTPEVTATQGIGVPAVTISASSIKLEDVVRPEADIVRIEDYTRSGSVSPSSGTAPLSAVRG